MNLSKPILGLLLLALCCTAWGKTYEEYDKEARSKSKVCQNYEETKLNNSKKSMGQSGDYYARLTEEGNLGAACYKDMLQYLPPEALPLLEAHKKARLAEQVAEGMRNPDGTLKKRPFYDDWFNWNRTKNEFMDLLNSIGSLLLVPIAFITIGAGLMLITKPREFTKLFFSIIQGIVELLFKKTKGK